MEGRGEEFEERGEESLRWRDGAAGRGGQGEEDGSNEQAKYGLL